MLDHGVVHVVVVADDEFVSVGACNETTARTVAPRQGAKGWELAEYEPRRGLLGKDARAVEMIAHRAVIGRVQVPVRTRGTRLHERQILESTYRILDGYECAARISEGTLQRRHHAFEASHVIDGDIAVWTT